MGDMLKADFDGIRSLGAQLRAQADEVSGVAAPAKASVAAVVMAAAGIDDLMGRLSSTLEAAVAKHSSAVHALADAALLTATTYEAAEDAFHRQLALLNEGLER